jgi:Calcium binding
MSKRSRRRTRTEPQATLPPPRLASVPPPRPPEHERLLLDQIASGELDAHLVAIAEAVRARHELLQTINSQKALAMLAVGDHVRINQRQSPIPARCPRCHHRTRPARRWRLRAPLHRPVQERRDPLPTTRPGPTQPSRLKRRPMSPARQADPELENLIEEITVDSHDEDEQLMGFETAFDEDANFPCRGTVVGEEVEVLSVSRGDNRRELIATCQRSGRQYDIALLDIDIHADPTTARLLAAYRRWLGA